MSALCDHAGFLELSSEPGAVLYGTDIYGGGARLSLIPRCPNREQRDPVYLRDKVTQRHSKEQFETAQKIEQEYSKYFTGECGLGRGRGRGRGVGASTDAVLEQVAAHLALQVTC